MKNVKRLLSMVLVLCMMLSVMPLNAFAADNDFIRVFHLDCGRKYFTVDQVKELIDAISNKGYSHMELAIGNDGLRLLLDDMSIEANGTTYDGETIKSGIQSGNVKYSHAGEWTETEMDEIIAYAKTKGIEIIPLVNNPGHMDAILAAMSACGIDGYYEYSSRTVDLENADAVAFTQALVMKYAEYFDGKGCKYFNIGADEYANDYHTAASTGMGFGHLIDNNMYGNFITYVNTLVADICDLGMTPIAFNDGIYFRENTSFGTFDTRLVVAAWTGGWGGIKPASTTFLQSKGHQILNTNERWYYVLGRSQAVNGTYCYESALSNAQSESVTTVTDHKTGVTSMGAMQCVWCDDPSVNYETYKSNVMTLINTLADSNPTYFTGPNEVVPEPEETTPEETTTPVETEPETVTKTDEATGIVASAPGLTDLTITEIKDETVIPTIEGVSKILAYDVSAFVGETSYTGEIEISVPVPADWTRVRGGVLASESGEEVLGIEGKLENGVFTFTVPHLSGVVTYASDYDKLIELEVGGTSDTITDNSGYYIAAEGLNTAVATVTLGGNAGSNATVKYTEANVSCNDLIDSNSNSWVATEKYYYTPDNGANYYPVYAKRTSSADMFSTTYTYTWGYSASGSESNVTQIGKEQSFSRGWFDDWATPDITVYTKSGTEAVPAKTTIAFKGVSVGETTATIGNTTYKIVVSKKQESATITVGDSKTYADNSTSAPVVANTAVADAVLEDGKLTITAKSVGTTTVTTDNAVYTINVVAFDPSTVTPLTVEYWITNRKVTIDGVNTKSISAAEVYSADGVTFDKLVPVTDGAAKPQVFWKGWLLPNGYHQELDSEGGLDMTGNENGKLITKIRYWDGVWQAFDGIDWTTIKSTDQVVAYYMQQTAVTTEVTTNVVDWGEPYSDWRAGTGETWFWDGYVETGTKYIFLDFAVVYEDRTQNPSTFPTDNTWFMHFDGHSASNPRILNLIAFTERNDYEIWKVTVTDGTSTGYSSASKFTSSYDDSTETVVWDENMGGDPRIEALTYTANRSGKLVRVYVRAVETEDSLTVVYYDEKFGDTLYEYNINVSAGKNFNADIGKANVVNGEITINTDNKPGAFANNANRIDITGYGIVNALGIGQTFETDLTQVTEAEGKYDSELYSYTGSRISEDGKTLYLYYNINTEVLKPNFVVDFGLPISFNLSDVTNTPDLVKSVSASARYGTVSYNSSTKIFTYTPTKILQNVDVLSVTLTFDGNTTTTSLTNVGVTPATSIYYEEGFLLSDDASGWTTTSPNPALDNQSAVVLGQTGDNNYGYDGAYASAGTNIGYITGTTGASTSFTFTGTGFQLYGNSNSASGYVTVYSQGNLSKLYMINTKLTDVKGDDITNTTYHSLPFISETALPYGTYTVQIKQTNNAGDIYLDGVRILNTVNDQTDGEDNIYYDDQEDKPVFYELRDMVLNAVGVNNSNSEYGTPSAMAGQVYNATNGATAIILDESYNIGSTTAQQLLDNGPKNELYLYQNQTLTFKVTTDRVVQLGLKAPTGSASFELNGTAKTLATSVDMFYEIAGKGEASNGYTVTIKNTGSAVLSITLLKICDDPNASFNALTAEDIEAALIAMGYTDSDFQKPEETQPTVPETTVPETTVPETTVPETTVPETTVPETTVPEETQPTEPEAPVEPETPVQPEEPVVPEEPEVTYADAVLTLWLVDYSGKTVASSQITLNGVEGEKASFSAEEVMAAVKAQLPKGYALVDESAVTAVEVEYGKEHIVSIQAGKVATLTVTYVNFFGRKVGSVTLTKVQTSAGSCRFTASEIRAAAPAGSLVLRLSNKTVSYGSNASLYVTVI